MVFLYFLWDVAAVLFFWKIVFSQFYLFIVTMEKMIWFDCLVLTRRQRQQNKLSVFWNQFCKNFHQVFSLRYLQTTHTHTQNLQKKIYVHSIWIENKFAAAHSLKDNVEFHFKISKVLLAVNKKFNEIWILFKNALYFSYSQLVIANDIEI